MWPFQSKCPVDAETKTWIDHRMNWLGTQFGMDTWRMPRAIEPTPEFFPDPYDRTQAAVQNMLNRVCGYMGIHPSRIDLQLYSEARNRPVGATARLESEGTGSAGHYRKDEKEVVAIEVSNLADPTKVVAIIAHELAHVRLLGEHRMTGEEEDLERVTDLATVFFGLGIFNANSRFSFSQWTRGNWQGWKATSLGYLDERMFGYALGLWAVTREEYSPRWARHLTVNPRSYTKQAIQFLKDNPQSM